MSKTTRRAGIIYAALLLLICTLLSGCQDMMMDIQPPGVASNIYEPLKDAPPAPNGDSRAQRGITAALYYVSEDGQRLVPTMENVTIQPHETAAEAVLQALLRSPKDETLAPIAPSSTQVIAVELAGDIATVNLSMDALNLDEESLMWLRYAITYTLSDLLDIHYVNVLIAGREEGTLSLPTGVLSRTLDQLPSVWTQLEREDALFREQEEDIRLLRRDAMLYFAASGMRYMLPEVRSLRFSGEDYDITLIEEMIRGPVDAVLLNRTLPDEASFLQDQPEIVDGSYGRRIVHLYFSGALTTYMADNDLSERLTYGCMVMTLAGFIPRLDGVMIYIDGKLITRVAGDARTFDDGVMRRQDFDALLGQMGTLYFPTPDGAALRKIHRAMLQLDVNSPRALINGLMEGVRSGEGEAGTVFPIGTTDADILGIRLEGQIALINLSSHLYERCRSMTALEERNMAYSIVNTLTTLPGITHVQFYIDGRLADTLAGRIYIKGTLTGNPGIIR